MKSAIYKIWTLLVGALMLLPSSCSDDIVPSPDGVTPGTGDKLVPIMVKLNDLSEDRPSTYASTNNTDYPGETPVGGSAQEDAIHDITVYVFDASFNCEKIIQASSSPTPPAMVRTGTKNLVAVVNASGKMTLPTTPAAVTYTGLKEMLINAVTALPVSPFLMTGEIQNVPIPDDLPMSNPYNVTINVERAVAKVTLRLGLKAQAAGRDIKLRKITLYQGANSVALFRAPASNPTMYSVTGSKTYTSPMQVHNSPVYLSIPDSFYTYESLCGTDKTKAVRIEIETEVNSSSNVRKAEFYLGAYLASGATDTVYDIKRNYWYDVTVDIMKPGMDSIYVKVVSCPWNVAGTQDTTAGAGYEAKTSLPFKLVKPYTESELSTGSNGKFAAIEKHTKGKSYIDLKVSRGASWNLDFKPEDAANAGAKIAQDAATSSWTSDWKTSLSGTGDGNVHRIWIYRPYVENAEPNAGPTLTLKVNGTAVQDFVVQPRDTTPIPTNCYIVRPQLKNKPYPINESRVYIPLAGVYKYWEDELMDNGDSIPNGTITAELSWMTAYREIEDPIYFEPLFEPIEKIDVSNIKVINANKRDSAYIYAEVVGELDDKRLGELSGNAIIDMKVNGVTYWSFHLWITEYNPYEEAGQIPFTSKNGIRNVFMDRDIGMYAKLRGLYFYNNSGTFYQNGRKDPFPGEFNGRFTWKYKDQLQQNLQSLTKPPFTVANSVAGGGTALRPKTALMEILKNPCTYYNLDNWPFYNENNYLWETAGGNKTAFDPCPEGWRIPSQTDEADSPWNSNEFFPVFTPSVYLYYVSSSGDLSRDICWGGWWSSYRNPNYGSGVIQEYHGDYTAALGRDMKYKFLPSLKKSCGFHVRCVIDKKYIEKGGSLFGTDAGGLGHEDL